MSWYCACTYYVAHIQFDVLCHVFRGSPLNLVPFRIWFKGEVGGFVLFNFA